MPPPVIGVDPLPKRRFGLTHFHLRNVVAEFDSGGCDRGLKLFVLRFHRGFIFVRPDADEFVLGSKWGQQMGSSPLLAKR